MLPYIPAYLVPLSPPLPSHASVPRLRYFIVVGDVDTDGKTALPQLVRNGSRDDDVVSR
jgi:hypothetical protein